MNDAGHACCYVLLAGRTAAVPAAGWTLLIDPQFEFGDADAQLRQWSVGGRVGRLLVLEHETFAHAALWTDGELDWAVSYEAELDDRPVLSGRLPYDLDALAAALGSRDEPRTWYAATMEAFRLATRFRA